MWRDVRLNDPVGTIARDAERCPSCMESGLFNQIAGASDGKSQFNEQ